LYCRSIIWDSASLQAQRSGQVEAKCRQQLGSAPTSSGISAAQLENETDELKHATVPKDLKMAIMKGRQAKQLTQKQLAQVSDLQDAREMRAGLDGVAL